MRFGLFKANKASIKDWLTHPFGWGQPTEPKGSNQSSIDALSALMAPLATPHSKGPVPVSKKMEGPEGVKKTAKA